MELNDLLILLSIVVAIIAIVEANNKKIWLYKFSALDVVLFAIFFILVFGLIKYDDCIKRWPELYNTFYWEKGFHSRTWAFFLSIGLLLVFIIRVSLQKRFPKCRRSGIIKYYRRLTFSDIHMLVDFLYQYHIRRGKNTENYLFPLLIDTNFISKSVGVDQTLFPKLLIATNRYDLQHKSYTAIGYYTECIISDVNSQFRYELSHSDSALIVSQDKNIIDSIEIEGVLAEIFKDKDYTFTSIMLNTLGLFAVDQLLHSRTFDEDEALFIGQLNKLYFTIYIELYFVVMAHYATSNELCDVNMISHYYTSSYFSQLLPQSNDSENKKKNKRRLVDDILLHFSSLIYYCDNNNYTSHVEEFLNIRLKMFNPLDMHTPQYDDIWELIDLYLRRKIEWKNIDTLYKNFIGKQVVAIPQYHYKIETDINKHKDKYSQERVTFIESILKRNNKL